MKTSPPVLPAGGGRGAGGAGRAGVAPSDEVDDDGDCAVVLFLHGTVDGAAPAVVVVAVLIALAAVFVAAAQPAAFVPSVFARGRVFEHAPPAAT